MRKDSVRHSAIEFFLGITAIIGSVWFYLATALRNISRPGIYYDEITFVSAALNIDGAFLYKKIAGIPVAIMPYIGALKSWIYYPVFKYFGVSPETLRTPVILITVIALVVSFALVKRIFGLIPAIAAIILISTDPAFIYFTRLDYGPVVLMMLFKMSSLLFFFVFMDSKKTVYLWLTIICLGLGLYDKLNFIWFIIAFGTAVLCVYHQDLFSILKEKRFYFIIPSTLFLIFLAYVVLFFIIPLMKVGVGLEPIPFSDRLSFIPSLYSITMNGSAFFSFITGLPLKNTSIINYFLVPSFLIQIFFSIKVRMVKNDTAGGRIAKASFFFLLTFVFVFFQIFITQDARGGHHMMILNPLNHLCLLSAFCGLSLFLKDKGIERFGMVFLSAVFICIVFSQIKADTEYVKSFENDASYVLKWDPAIYELVKYTDSLGVDSVVSVDWGTFTQIFALTNKDRTNCKDLWIDFKTYPQKLEEEKKRIYEENFKGKTVAVVMHPEDLEEMKGNRKNFIEFKEAYSLSLSKAVLLRNTEGKAVYEVVMAKSNN